MAIIDEAAKSIDTLIFYYNKKRQIERQIETNSEKLSTRTLAAMNHKIAQEIKHKELLNFADMAELTKQLIEWTMAALADRKQFAALAALLERDYKKKWDLEDQKRKASGIQQDDPCVIKGIWR
ncbi:hypothetical protein L596_026491 [Steinernema carpocapsae]|uniref:Uncharacterized protein n=1 Tax=Steinernema carpocapsae TaxID=34508 RepID=A0A4U5M1J6_STECR|nr:hypothetical protein L596_026491 [Steinernema carpocapsae]